MSHENRKPLANSMKKQLEKMIDSYVEEGLEGRRRRFVQKIVEDAFRSSADNFDQDQLRLLMFAIKEIRKGFRLFNKYESIRKVAIYGSARTPPEHPDYLTARDFSGALAMKGWMSITGAGDGIMKAGHEGPRRDAIFGLAIHLPFEQTANSIIEGDEKLLEFRYFFTRKLMFMAHADAIAIFPGGFGTQDELFEALTLIQTGKSMIVPLVLLEGDGGGYWKDWEIYVRKQLLDRGMISSEDPNLWYRAPSVKSAVEYINSFYTIFHSMRYVKEWCVFRLERQLNLQEIDILNNKFSNLLESGSFESTEPLEGERAYLDKPRIRFRAVRREFVERYALVHQINSFGLDS